MLFSKNKKNPLLALAIFVSTYIAYKKIFQNELNQLPSQLSHCQKTLEHIQVRVAKNWIIQCKGNDLDATIPSDQSMTSKDKTHLYQQMAKNLIFMARNSPQDSLVNTGKIKIKLLGTHLSIEAFTNGLDLFALARIKNQKSLTEHLKTTVRIKEIIK